MRNPKRDAGLAGALAAVSVVAALAFDPTATVDLMRQRVFDRMLDATAPSYWGLPRIVVIDIDAASLARVGPWPWRRERIAALICAARRAGAVAVGVDILFAARDAQSPAALARELAAATGDARVAELAASLKDDDSRLAEALAPGVVLGFALSPEPETSRPPMPPILTRGPVRLAAAWTGGGVYPASGLAERAALGALSLPGDADGIVRRAPLFVATGAGLRPSLALETTRAARGASAYILEADPARVVSGALSLPLPRDAMLRLAPPQRIETLSAADWLGEKPPAPLPGAVVFIGASAPEAGGLRASARDPLTPSTLIQAQAARQIGAGFAPLEAPPGVARAIGLGLAGALIALAALARPAVAFGAALAAIAAIFAGATALAAIAFRLVDPVEMAAPAFAGFAAAAAMTAAAARRRAQFLRARFERHLAPQVIDRIIASADAAKLSAERRDITALFTDIEGFTGMVGCAAPERLVAALDGYFEGLTRIALAHGGLVDKFVGDAANVFFNMPFDLDAHATRALDCAEEMASWTETYRGEPGPAALGFGRTRIGIESGPAMVGDIGGGAKLDYTAHGDTVNAAARLEQANKQTGTAICVGPGATSRIARERLRPIGELTLRGFPHAVAAASPWPAGSSAEWRAAYLAAYARRETAPKEAAQAFAALAAELGDPLAAAFASAAAS